MLPLKEGLEFSQVNNVTQETVDAAFSFLPFCLRGGGEGGGGIRENEYFSYTALARDQV